MNCWCPVQHHHFLIRCQQDLDHITERKWKSRIQRNHCPGWFRAVANFGKFLLSIAEGGGYRNGAAMDASEKLLRGNKGWAEFQRTLGSLVEFEWENTYAILRAKVNEGDVSNTNPVSIVYGITVTDSAAFMLAFNKLWNSAAIQEFPGAVYLGESIAAGTMPGTHFVTFVADSRGKLTEAMMAMKSSKEMASYMEIASGARALEAINMFFELKRWANGG